MSKNKQFIESQKRLHKTIDNVTPSIYASIALALHRACNLEYDDINTIFACSKDIWNECVINNDDMVDMCEKETGICVMSHLQAKQQGYE